MNALILVAVLMLIIVGAIGLVIELLISRIERRLLHWQGKG